MKKFKKLFAVLSSAIMALSVGLIQVSASFEEKTYDTTYTKADGTVVPIRVYDTMDYMGIIFQVSGETVPTAEELGIDAVVKEYDPVNYGYGLLEKISGNSLNWGVEDIVEPTGNQYTIQTEHIMSEAEAEEFAKKMVVRGLAEEAGVWYWHSVSNGTISESGNDNRIIVNFKGDSQTADFSIEKYPEIKETLKYSEYDIEIKDSYVLINCNLENSIYMNAETNDFDSMSVYNDVVALNEIMTSNYDEIENVDIIFSILYSDDDYKNAVYSVEPIWGDATNDDVIDLYDAIEIAKYIMNISDIDEDTVLLADINRDGVTDLYDAIEVAKLIMEN